MINQPTQFIAHPLFPDSTKFIYKLLTVLSIYNLIALTTLETKKPHWVRFILRNTASFFNSNLLDILLIIKTIHIISCIQYIKGTILKANHNNCKEDLSSSQLYSIYQRYDFESKSQQAVVIFLSIKAVFNISKVRFWKQITTEPLKWFMLLGLYSIYQRYDFESKSQLSAIVRAIISCCIQYIKGTILKANHNIVHIRQFESWAVFNISKVRFWKQITTSI